MADDGAQSEAISQAQAGAEGTQASPTEVQKQQGGKLAPDSKQKKAGHDEKQDDQQVNEKANGPTETEKEKQGNSTGVDKQEKNSAEKDKKQPEGGYDGVPVPKRDQGWTIRITVHRATNLPIADINTLSSDPYIITQIYTDVPNRHKEDPPLRMRTPTIRRNTDPTWDWPWTIANVPSSGFKLKLRMYDEDPSDHDDRLGNVHIHVNSLGDNFQNILEQSYKIKKRSGSKRAYLVRAFTTCFGMTKHLNGELVVSIELLGRTAEDGQNGRLYTVGPCWWTAHFSPILGRLANTHDDDNDNDGGIAESSEQKEKKKAQKFNFQANQIQLAGPVPKELYHRFVEFKPWVKTMFTASGILGWFVSKALHAQHDRVYHFDRNTKWGTFPNEPGTAMTDFFLKQVHYDQGARIFTYVLTLDALWRFTETGKEFGIDMLSKHTMHSDVGVYIAFSGEFFIRRLKKPKQPSPPEPVEEASQSHPPAHEQNEEHPPKDVDGGPPKGAPPKDPKYYELVIDNDSGTYRPNAELLPLLKKFLSLQLPDLHILVLDCQRDADKMNKMKDEQRERKKAEGDGIVYLQGDDGSSISSSDEEDLDALASGSAKHERGPFKQAARDFKRKEEARVSKLKRDYDTKQRPGHGSGDVDEAAETSDTANASADAKPGAT